MHNVLMIVRREFMERVTKKSFWIGTCVFPIVIVGLTTVPMLLINLGGDTQKKVAVVDATGQLEPRLASALAGKKLKDGSPRYVIESVPATSFDAAASSLIP